MNNFGNLAKFRLYSAAVWQKIQRMSVIRIGYRREQKINESKRKDGGRESSEKESRKVDIEKLSKRITKKRKGLRYAG